MWGKLYKKGILENTARLLNVVLANKIVYSEDLLLSTAILSCDPVVAGVNVLGYSYYHNPSSVSKNMTNTN
jgi:hypothetical protein